MKSALPVCLYILMCHTTTYSVEYANDVKPLLKEKCATCHSSLKQEGDLRLDAARLFVVQDDRNIVLAGNSQNSELIKRITSTDKDVRMPPEGARLTEEQVNVLSKWIDSGAAFPSDEQIPVPPEQHWAFQPVVHTDLPNVADATWVFNPIDLFYLSQLDIRKEMPEEDATASQLLRRVYLDLTGLPPTVQEQDEFSTSGNLDRVIDDLLSRPAYAERWARHWLDVARYADTNGYERDAEKPFVWRYRDYVIDSFNHDKPFNQFVVEQIAGDLLEEKTAETVVATGFLRLGNWDDEPADPATDRYDQLDDIISTTGQAFLGITIGCARCHDHKFEPLSTKDYYSLVSIFDPLERPRMGRTELTVTEAGTEIYAFVDKIDTAAESFILIRGSPNNKGAKVSPSAPNILARTHTGFESSQLKQNHRRLQFANWLVDEANPLTARVIVNRIWQQHFGNGIVSTASDFGLMGERPTDPALLDWLADWFMHEAKWSIKKLHKLMLSSHTWQTQKSHRSLIQYRRLEVEAIRDSMLAVSGQLNLKRFGPSMKPSIPKAAIEANTDKDNVWKASDEIESSRRSVYAFIKRGLIIPMFESLDLADTVSSCPKRQVTTVAPQALSLFNGDFSQLQAKHFANRLRIEAGNRLEVQVSLAWQIAICRRPSLEELKLSIQFAGDASLEQFCRVLLNLNEFVYTE